MLRQLGTITLGNKVTASDPCYESGIWCAKVLEIKPGTYHCFAEVLETSWGTRIQSLRICHEDYLVGRIDYKRPSNVGVDSGQFGFFDTKYYEAHQPDDNYDNPESWYRKVCNITLSDEQSGTIEEKGVVSSSGYGDGVYGLYPGYNEQGEIVAASVDFFDENEDDEDNEDESWNA